MYRQHDMRQTRGRHDTGAWHATPRVSLGPTWPSSPQCWKGFLLMQWGTRWSSCRLAFRSRVVTKTSFLWAHRIHTQPRETRIVPKSLCQTRLSQFSGHSFSTCSQQHSALPVSLPVSQGLWKGKRRPVFQKTLQSPQQQDKIPRISVSPLCLLYVATIYVNATSVPNVIQLSYIHNITLAMLYLGHFDYLMIWNLLLF